MVSACVSRRLPSLLRQLSRSCPLRQQLRRQLLTMQLTADQLQPLRSPEVETLAEMFRSHGYELRLAGGAVRDMLSGRREAKVAVGGQREVGGVWCRLMYGPMPYIYHGMTLGKGVL